MKRSVKAAIVALVAIAIVCLIAGVLASMAIHKPSILLIDPDEPDVADDYDVIRLEGELTGDIYLITLTVAGEVQAGYYYSIIPLCQYRVGVWVKEVGEQSSYVYDLLFIEDEEQHYGIPATREGSSLTFEFPISFLFSNAYIVGLSAFTDWEDGNSSGTRDIVGETPCDDCAISHLLELPLNPLVLFVAAAICLMVAVIVPLLRP